MTKREFLEGLKSALGNNLSGPVIQENVDYYSSYISEEIKKGRPEEEVTAELGDPWVIARTITDSVEGQDHAGYQEGNSYEPSGNTYGGQRTENRGGFVLKPVSKWKVLLVIIGIIGIFMVMAAVVGGIISFLAPIIVPVIIVMIVIRALGNRRR